MKFLPIKNQTEAAEILAAKIADSLKQDKKVLWLLSGGSNIPLSVSALEILKTLFSKKTLKANLAVTLTDERYGPVSYPFSNWQHLIKDGFKLKEVKAVPVLSGLSLEETVKEFEQNYKKLTQWADIIIGQFGIGVDGHIAGVLPDTIGVNSKEIACAYEAVRFTRISLTLNTIKNISVVYAFVFGSAKKTMLHIFHNHASSLEEMPALILKHIPEAYLYSDQA